MSKESFHSSKEEKNNKVEEERIKKIEESFKHEGRFIREIFKCVLIQRVPVNMKKMGFLKDSLKPLRATLEEMQVVKESSGLKQSQKEREYKKIIEKMPVEDFFISIHVHGSEKIKKILALAENDLLQTLEIKIEETSTERMSKNDKSNKGVEIQISKGELIGGCDD